MEKTLYTNESIADQQGEKKVYRVEKEGRAER